MEKRLRYPLHRDLSSGIKQLAPGGKDARKMLESGGMNQSLFMR